MLRTVVENKIQISKSMTPILLAAVIAGSAFSSTAGPQSGREKATHLAELAKKTIRADTLLSISTNQTIQVVALDGWDGWTSMVDAPTAVGRIRMRNQSEYFIIHFEAKDDVYLKNNDPMQIIKEATENFLQDAFIIDDTMVDSKTRTKQAVEEGRLMAIHTPQKEGQLGAVFCSYCRLGNRSGWEGFYRLYVLVNGKNCVVVVQKEFPRRAFHRFSYDGLKAYHNNKAVYSILLGISEDSCLPLPLHEGCIWPTDESAMTDIGSASILAPTGKEGMNAL